MRFKPTGISATDYGTGIVLNVGVPVIYAKQIESLVGDFRPNCEWELKPYRQERLPCKQRVMGSSPISGSIIL